jgi:hypothetical protein
MSIQPAEIVVTAAIIKLIHILSAINCIFKVGLYIKAEVSQFLTKASHAAYAG